MAGCVGITAVPNSREAPVPFARGQNATKIKKMWCELGNIVGYQISTAVHLLGRDVNKASSVKPKTKAKAKTKD